MAKRKYTIYTDESSKKGPRYGNFYGGVLVQTSDVQAISDLLNSTKSSLNLHGEIKWTKITAPYVAKYIEFIQTFFEFVSTGRIKVRIMFTDRRIEASNLTDYQREHRYFMLYYQFIKHGFGLMHSNPNSLDRISIELLIDNIPDTKLKVNQFKSFLSRLSETPEYYGRQILFPKSFIGEIDSKNHVIHQGLDIILGAMHFRLNDYHLKKPDGAQTRGRRTIAKEKVYKAISKEIRTLHPNFNIGLTTGRPNGPINSWNQLYRHWIFKPNDYDVVS